MIFNFTKNVIFSISRIFFQLSEIPKSFDSKPRSLSWLIKFSYLQAIPSRSSFIPFSSSSSLIEEVSSRTSEIHYKNCNSLVSFHLWQCWLFFFHEINFTKFYFMLKYTFSHDIWFFFRERGFTKFFKWNDFNYFGGSLMLERIRKSILRKR